MAFLEGPSAKQAEVIKQELGENDSDLKRGVTDLQSMLAASPHLPDPNFVETKFLEIFIRGCRMDQERARNKLESFFLSRSRFCDLYEHISINVPPLSESWKFMQVIPLPKLTDEGYRVTVARMLPDYPDSSADIANAVRTILLVSDVRMRDETLLAGDVFIWEVSHVRSSVVAKVMAALSALRRSIYLAQAAYPQRMKRIHVVGARPFLASSLQLIRSCVNEKVRQRYYIHSKIEELHEYMPARMLPEEWGGQEDSLDSLARRWRNRVDDLKDYLQNLNDICNAVPAPVLDNDIYGTAGAFRKLDID